jgi:hypothetical protein
MLVVIPMNHCKTDMGEKADNVESLYSIVQGGESDGTDIQPVVSVKLGERRR